MFRITIFTKEGKLVGKAFLQSIPNCGQMIGQRKIIERRIKLDDSVELTVE